MALSKDEILDAIAEMSVMDIVALVEAMEEKFGVSAAAAVAVAAPAAGGDAGGAAAEEGVGGAWTHRGGVVMHQSQGAPPRIEVAREDDDGVPVVMGFLPSAVNTREDRPVILYAGSLSCLNTKLERFCHSSANRGERVCQLYKQLYLNDATLLYTRLLRAEMKVNEHYKTESAATRERFARKLAAETAKSRLYFF